jgi:hypothetical protein
VLANGEELPWATVPKFRIDVGIPIRYRMFEPNLIAGDDGFKQVYI